MDTSFQDDFQIITSIRSDRILLTKHGVITSGPSLATGSLYMFHFHQDRMFAGSLAFNWPEIAREELSNLHEYLIDHLKQRYNGPYCGSPLKLRATLSSSGSISVDSTPTAAVIFESLFPRALSGLLTLAPNFRIFISPVACTPTLFTRHKTTNRAQYDEVRSLMPETSNRSDRQDVSHLTEILLVNDKEEISEGSITTPYFLRAGEWITPDAECGGNLGTTRRYALMSGLCKEGIISRHSVQVGEQIVLSNGVRGFGWGYIERLDHMRADGITSQQ